MEPVIVERAPELAVGMGDSFEPKSTNEIGALWGRFMQQHEQIKHAKSDYMLGICSCHHKDVEKKPGHSIIYIAASPVTGLEDIPSGMVACELPGGRYAKFTHKGKVSNLPHTVDYIWGTWLPKGLYEFRDAPDFELYDERFNAETMDGEIDIFIPIV